MKKEESLLKRSKIRLCAVVVTYNRKALLKECLSSLLSQTIPPDRIIVVDNASTDGTREFLTSLNHPSIEPLLLEENKGGAGGFYAGIERALSLKYDWIWVMDDDAEPEKDALEKLLHCLSPKAVALASLKVENDSPFHHHRGFFDFSIFRKGLIRPLSPENLKGRCVSIDHSSFVGLLLRAETLREIGLPRRDFFIKFDDLEYCLRLREKGKIILSTESKIIHKAALKKKKTTWSFIANHYYARRNLLIILNERRKLKFYLYSIYSFIKALIEVPFVLLSGGEIFVKLKVNFLGVIHGIKGKTGKLF